MTGWQKADELARQFAEVAGHLDGDADVAFAKSISELAVVVRDCAERVGLRAPGPIGPLEVGQVYRLQLEVTATVTERNDGAPGPSYELELDRRDFMDGRTVSVDADEITAAEND